MITYRTGVGSVAPNQVSGFFVGWPVLPSAEKLIEVMDSSYRRVWALEGERVVGYINAISDGVLTAFIPWLEVHPDYQGQGVGTELVNRLVAQLEGMYSIDLACDEDLIGYYERLGFFSFTAMGKRNRDVLR
ncbi:MULTISPECIES: GNAT family N-acetyltransferase [Dermabacter]|uniref:GNAT family N-acetyltransferase n=1 Tax=Dermabacter jinjuensis TaxID=1667168 RepID=A0ABN5DNU4_9MICO|nr:GNAT family N-acetyltransferase [Dermabacter jinjuensis]ATH96958.1 GNAT family N-acetyltransferase [Dermabacter jinjuensis]MDK8804502.1 GNAT family N-acetyltransferase [Dermabacter hominis]UEB89114.1 GNAT family N-acetyltransferase [Dermabacter jinjuensis]